MKHKNSEEYNECLMAFELYFLRELYNSPLCGYLTPYLFYLW